MLGQRAARLCSPKQKGRAMGLFTKDIKTMNDLFLHQLKDTIMPKSSW